MRIGRCKRGFSLLEVMIALAIVSIALVTLLGLSNRSIQVQERIRKLTQATLLAQQLMNEREVLSGTNQSWEMEEDQFEEPFSGFRWQISYQDTIISGVKEIRVTVLWGEAVKNEQVELTSFIRLESGS